MTLSIGDRLALWRHRLELRLNRPLGRRMSDTTFENLWSGWPRRWQNHAAPHLLVSLTTHRRPGSARRVINALKAALDTAGLPQDAVRLVVLNDPSDVDDTSARRAVANQFGDSARWLDARQRLGKAGFWKTHQSIFLIARQIRTAYHLSLQDDLRFDPGMLRTVFELWQATADDPRRRVLYLYSERAAQADAGGRWIDFERTPVAGLPLCRTQWFDLQAYFCDAEYLRILRYWVAPVPAARWRLHPDTSSGVGQQFTLRSRGRANIYQAYPSLVTHGHESSEMNPAARGLNPLDNR